MNTQQPVWIDRDDLLHRVRALPSLPAAVTELLSLMRSQEARLEEVAATVGLDQALAAKALQVANSPFYGVSGRVASIREAVNILGLRQLGTLVLAAAMTVQFERLHGKSLHLDEFWSHSIGCAVAARVLARAKGMDEAAAFSAGLLHDVGRLVLDSLYPDEMAQALEFASRHDRPAFESELALFGIGHAEVGGWVGRQWHFADDIVLAITRHHHPPAAAQATLADLVHGADALVHALDLAGDPHESVPGLDLASWRRVGLDPATLVPLLAEVEQEFKELRAALRPAKEHA